MYFEMHTLLVSLVSTFGWSERAVAHRHETTTIADTASTVAEHVFARLVPIASPNTTGLAGRWSLVAGHWSPVSPPFVLDTASRRRVFGGSREVGQLSVPAPSCR